MELKGKKIAFLGDSITEGCGTSDIKKVYWNVIGELTGATVVGNGIGGTRIARNLAKCEFEDYDEHYFGSRVDELPADADMVVIFGGTNDYGHGDAPLGDINSTDDYTFYGALNNLYTRIIRRFPRSKVVVLTPTHRGGENMLINERGVRNQTNLAGYVKIIREVAEKYGLPVIDFYAKSGISPEIPEQFDYYMPDGLHPSDAGNRRLAEFFVNAVKEL